MYTKEKYLKKTLNFRGEVINSTPSILNAGIIYHITMSNAVIQSSLVMLFGALLALTIPGCSSFRGNTAAVSGKANPDEARSSVRPLSYRMIAVQGSGVSRMYYYSYLFPPIQMSKNGIPVEKMTPVMGENGVIEKWNAGSVRSSALSHSVGKSFRHNGHNLISFPELLARDQPYSVLVVSTFYTAPLPLKKASGGGPNRMITIKIKGALFGLDMNPDKSLPVGNVLCTGFYSAEEDDVKLVIDKLLAEAVRYLGEQFDDSGLLFG